MPLYEYLCPKCGTFELVRKFSDVPLERCPTCDGPIEKLASAPAIQFKGTGWYITDYARKSSGGEGGKEKGGSSEGGKDKGGGGEGGKEKGGGESGREKGAAKEGSKDGGPSSSGETKRAASESKHSSSGTGDKK